jgi:hypothetical protein
LRETSQDFGFFGFRRVTTRNGKFWQIFVANSAPAALSLAAVPHPPVLTQHSTIRTMPPRAQAALLMGMIFFVLVSILFFDFLLEEESQQRQQEEDAVWCTLLKRLVENKVEWKL